MTHVIPFKCNEENETSKSGEVRHVVGIESTMYYLERATLYETEKPYTMRYDPEEDIPQTNFKKTKYPMTVKSMRDPGAGPFHLDQCGFQLIEFKSQLSYDEFWDNEKLQRVYVQEVKDTLKNVLGAKYVHVLDYAVRKRHADFPVYTGGHYQYDQPTAMAHIDFTVEEGERITKVLFGDKAGEVLKGRWQAINVWKPIKGPLNDWPLSLCDMRSVDFDMDILSSDVVFDDFFTENVQILHNPNFQWYYLPDHKTSEALIFKSADSIQGNAGGCPHSGFPNPNSKSDERRESLDCRCFVYFADLEEYPPVVGDIFQPHAQTM